MKFKNLFRVTQSDLAAQEISVVEGGVARLQALADHHRSLAETYQAGVDRIVGTAPANDEPMFVQSPQPLRRAGVAR